ncbi:unnamed protein product [Arctia plantaginis]|uniref:Uncharacterized protein n=1 Tax=Arctia plantaginis TaxID=874455 RepID=A0A8S1A627_ARCPL|nr:unnamed protein product [Arctia plantaginis]
MLFVLLLLLPGLKTEESTLSSLTFKTFKNLPFDAVKFLKQIEPTKQGPVLFPNDGPTPPPTPLIVTSRPLIESIRRSELNPNNTVQASSQLNQVTFRPEYFDSGMSSTPHSYSATSAPLYEYVRVPFQKVSVGNLPGIKEINEYVRDSSLRPAIYRGSSDNINSVLREPKKPTLATVTVPDYEYRERSTLPPIYRAFSDYANNVLRQEKNQALNEKPVYEYQNNIANYKNYNTNPGTTQENNGDHNYGDNYAFSYTVKDHKTGDDFSHSQSSSGSATNGEYRVRLPDGRMQIVSYTADEGGYKADVRYDDIETSSENNNPLTKEHRFDDFDYRYLNDRYAINSSKGLNNNDKAISYHDLSEDNLYVDYADKNKKSYATNYNNDILVGKLFTGNNSYKLYPNDNVSYNNDINGDIYNDKINQPNLNDYDLYEDKDYSSENVNYQPYTSKYSLYRDGNSAVSNTDSVKSTVVPPYHEIKDLFVTKNPVLSLADRQESIPNRVVTIEPKKHSFFTNIKKVLTAASVSPNPLYYTTSAPALSTPSGRENKRGQEKEEEI